ncbi:MAG: trypsin-like peptidase domain-containing protein [Clostridia bacterium]|nr:trypsin-like peptidase domain-containing protein [Clostridia bacterium]
MKKAFTVLLAVILTVSMLTGCINVDFNDFETSSVTSVASGAETIDELVNSINSDIAQTSSVESTATESSAQTPASSEQSTVSSPVTATGRTGIADVVDRIADSVVAINVSGVAYDYFNREYPSEGAGSGVIISSDGYIVTNCHVVSGGTKITVFLNNGDVYDAKLIGQYAEGDLALIKIEASGLTAAKLSDSSTLRVGDSVIAIGNPLGELQGTVTTGIVSALERDMVIDGQQMVLMQTNAAINSGNSGGGLFDSNGELIGIVTAKTSAAGVEGLGFFIPINNAKPVIAELKQHGYVTGRPYVGIATVDIANSFAARMNGVSWLGAYVSSVDPDSPAAQYGLRAVDYIVSVDGQEISHAAQVDDIIAGKKVGDTITFVVYRNNTKEPVTVQVVVGEKKQ